VVQQCRALFDLLSQLPAEVKGRIQRIAIDGTSATTILLDKSTGIVLAPAKLYNESQEDSCVRAAAVRLPAAVVVAMWHLHFFWEVHAITL
jgi:sugar (pentulose or hexulose) kinase